MAHFTSVQQEALEGSGREVNDGLAIFCSCFGLNMSSWQYMYWMLNSQLDMYRASLLSLSSSKKYCSLGYTAFGLCDEFLDAVNVASFSNSQVFLKGQDLRHECREAEWEV